MGLVDAMEQDPIGAPAPAAERPSAETLGRPASAGPADQRARRLYRRFLQCWHHPMWRRWRREAKEDLDFHSGVGQWPEAVRRKLEAEERACLTINQIRPVVQVLTGYERTARLEMRPVPVGPEDLENTTVLGRVMKKVDDEREISYTLSEGFKEGVVTGLKVFYVGVDYSTNLIDGEPDVVPVRRGEVCWDPDWTRYDLRDAREVFWYKTVAVEDLLSLFPDKREAIRGALNVLTAANPGAPVMIPSHDPRDAYREGDVEALPLYDQALDEVLVLNAWYLDWRPVTVLVDRETAAVTEFAEQDPGIELARALRRLNPERYRIAERRRRKVQMSTILPATLEELENGNPFENDDEDYPFVPFVAYREGDEILGIVRNLKDPQREVNKRRSAVTDNVVRHGNMKWFSTKNALENPDFLQAASPQAGDVGWLRNPNIMPKEVAPQPMPEWVLRMDGVAKNEIREISTVNADLLGYRDPDSSGIAIARRQQQGQISASELFDNYKRTRKLVGRRLAKRIQQTYTGEMVLRLDASAGQSELVTINQVIVDDLGRKKVLRDIPSMKYDVQIADSPATPTARAQALATLLELVDKLPAIAPAVVDIIVELTDLPDRERILNRIRAMLPNLAASPEASAQGGKSPYQPAGPAPVVGAPARQRTGAQNTPAAAAGIAPAPGGPS